MLRPARSNRSFVEMLEQRTLLATGDLDLRFGESGIATTNYNLGIDNAHAIAIQADGKILVAGDADNLGAGQPADGFFVARFNSNGSLDDGSVFDRDRSDHFGVEGQVIFAEGAASFATAMAVQKDGKIIVAGYADSVATQLAPAQQYWLLIRLNVDGSLDTTFGDDGEAVFKFGNSNTPLNAIALQNDGKIVVAGSWNDDWLIARLTPDGQTDFDFKVGYVTTDFGGVDTVGALAVDGLGRIVVAGGVDGSGELQKFGLARYLPNGDLDKSFGTDGKAVPDSEQLRREITGMVIQNNGQILVSNSAFNSPGVANWDAIVSQFNEAGNSTQSDGFGGRKSNGITLMPNGEFAAVGDVEGVTEQPVLNIANLPSPVSMPVNSSFSAVAAAPDGSIYAAGFQDPKSGERDFLLMKFKGVDPLTWGTISGNVFNDKDGDHVKDANETGIVHVRVFADVNNDGVWDQLGIFSSEPSAYTDINGNYSLLNLTLGTYPIRQELPSGYKQESPASVVISAAAHLGETTSGVNFVDTPIVPPSTKTAINGSVFNDWNSDGKREISKPTEPDLARITVFIDANKNGKLDAKEQKTTTDGGGNYSLALSKAGAARVAVVLPKGWSNTTAAFYDVNVAPHKQVTERFGLALIDPDDTIAEVTKATPLVLGKGIADALDSALDVNLYRFTVKAGQTIAFDLDLLKGSKLDSYLRLFDSKGVQLAANNNAAAPGEPKSSESYIKFKFTAAGTYYIGVSDHLNTAYNPLTGKGDIGGGTLGAYLLNTLVL